MMIALCIYFRQLCLLKETPENLPYSFLMMVLGAMVFILVMIFQWYFSRVFLTPDLLVLGIIGFSLSLSFVIYTYGLLYFTHYKERFIQTMTSLFWVHIIIHLLAVPLLLFDPYLSGPHGQNPLIPGIGLFYLFVALGLSVWQFVVTAHIFKHALSTTPVQSVLAAFGLIAVNILTVSFWR